MTTPLRTQPSRATIERSRSLTVFNSETATQRLFQLAAGQVEFSSHECLTLFLACLDAGGSAHEAAVVMQEATDGLMACYAHYQDLVRYYLKYGGQRDAVNSNGRSLLSIACQYNDYVASSLMIEGGRPTLKIIKRMERERNWFLLGDVAELFPEFVTPNRATAWLKLMVSENMSCDQHDKSTVLRLLAAGANPNVLNGEGLRWAINSELDEVGAAMIEAGADINLLCGNLRGWLQGVDFMPKTRSAVRCMELGNVPSIEKRRRAWASGQVLPYRSAL